MSYWGNRASALMLVSALALSACGTGEDLGDVQQKASKEVSSMRFFKDADESVRMIGAASTVEEVERVLAAARERDQEQADKYWRCAAGLAGMLDGALLTTQVVGDARFEELTLDLDADGSASLESAGHAEMTSALEPSEAEVWLLDSVGEVSGWEANLDELIEKRELVERKHDPYVSGERRCNLHFDLVLATSTGKQEKQAYVQRGPQDSMTVFIDGHGFDWVR